MKMTSVKPIQKGGIKSKIICKYFIQGKCIKGENCPYMHSQIEKPKEMTEEECPMYTIGFCKNGPRCHFLHIKKDTYIKEEIEEKISNSKTQNEEKDAEKNNLNEENQNSNEKNGASDEANENIEKDKNQLELPIWYLEHYYDKPISMIFFELEQKKLPEIVELKKKYGFTNIEPNLPIMQPIVKKNKTNFNMNMNTLNLNFNNLNMNLISNNNHINNTSIKNNIIQNTINNNQINQNNQINNDIKFDAYKFKKDNIEYLINKEDNIYYYLIRGKNYDEIKQSSESNTIILPEEIYNKYKEIDLKNKKITVIIILFDDEGENLAGFAQLKYPINNEQEKKYNANCYKIEWLWRTKLHYSKICHLMNRADNDHFLNEGKNGCPIDKDLGNYCCRLMIKRLSKDEVKELINEKKIFENQKYLLNNLKKEEYVNDNYKYNNDKYNNKYNYKYNNYSDNKYKDKYSIDKFNNYSDNKYNKKFSENSSFKYSNKKSYLSDMNSNKYNSSKKKEMNYTGHKKYRNNSNSRNHNKRSDSEDYLYKNKKEKIDDDNNFKYDNSNYKVRSNNYHNHRYYNNDDNKSTDFSSKKSYH